MCIGYFEMLLIWNIILYLLSYWMSATFALKCVKSDFLFFALSPLSNRHDNKVISVNLHEAELPTFLLTDLNSSTNLFSTETCTNNANACFSGYDINPSSGLMNESFLLSLSSLSTIMHIQQNNKFYALASRPSPAEKQHRRSHQMRGCVHHHQPERSFCLSDTCAFYYKYVLFSSNIIYTFIHLT